MSRPSICPACYCYEHCLFPGVRGCAEDAKKAHFEALMTALDESDE